MATATRPAAAEQLSYQDLYARWEQGNWSATELDFSQDREDWHNEFSELERKAALWNYAMFFHGEDSVADNLSPYIDAAPLEEQKYFLATQQVDEARHAVFFGRFMREVIEAGDDIASSLHATKPELTWGFRKVFEQLDRTADELRRDRSKPMLAAAVALYHIVIEATLAQPGQHFIEDYLDERKLLPGFFEGMGKVSRDEQRHIGFGVKLLSDLIEEDPECKDAVIDMLREVGTRSTGVFVPPNWDMRYVECFGSTLLDVYSDGLVSLESKLRAAGFTDEDLAASAAVPWELPVRERAARTLAMLRANYLGEKLGPPARDPDSIGMLFDSVRRAADPRAELKGPVTFQWDFADTAPWYVVVNNGDRSARQGQADKPDVTFRCNFEDWVDIAAGREEPQKAMLKRKLRLRGNPRVLWRTRNLFR